MKQSLLKIKNEAAAAIVNKTYLGPVLESLDLALFSGEKWFFSITSDEYVEITSAFSLILDDPRVLVVPEEGHDRGVGGFISIYDKLDQKFSHSIQNNLSEVKVIIFSKDCNKINYKKVTENVIINSQSSYNDVINSLKTVEYSQVDFVEQPKEFCVKGGVIDIYSPIYNNPVRVCLYDTETSINFYSLATGLSLNESMVELKLSKRENVVTSMSSSALLSMSKITNKIETTKHNPKHVGPFVCLDYKSFIKEKKQVIYVEDLNFYSFQYNNKVVAPNSFKGGAVSSPQQEDVALQKGDVVCHEDFGVGLLIGLIGDAESGGDEYLKIKYEDAVVQLSIKNLYKLSFVSRETSEDIKLNSLSKKGVWARQKSRVAGFVENKTKDLLEFYASKKNNYRAPYPFGGDIEKEFIASFVYEDTPDQGLAWEEISKDLKKETPMYRLLCGDVGFGKTEISLRASFRVVINGGKVIILAPTSVLARQHYSVFKERLNPFGVVVELFVGSVTTSNKNDIKNRWVERKIDVLIGTSALLYSSVFIKYTNLFVVDEEHKFGVKDKEGVLEGFINKDVLLMSATPIPRSLNLSLSGLNDISTLGSPPIMRKPIQTFVNYFGDNLIKRAVEYETNRSGQVFFVHNNINSLVSIKNYLKRLCPMVSILIAHSKVPKKELQNNIELFVKGQADVLLCTSIIGSGIDIPNANTIIVNSAHKFGLGQLHQIRGRVGRSDKQGYAYMLIPESTNLNVKAKKRLITIEKNISLGSGYHIAKSDLQIRGGGMMFGYDQSGKSFDFGFEFYSKLMSKYISKNSNSTKTFLVDNFVYNVDFVCAFPNNYIADGFERLRNYRLLNSIYSKSKLSVFCDNLKDKYGPLPAAAVNMVNMRLLSFVATEISLMRVVINRRVAIISFNNTFKRGSELFKFLAGFGKSMGVINYSFKDLEQATELSLEFGVGVSVDAAFLLSFLNNFKGFYEKV